MIILSHIEILGVSGEKSIEYRNQQKTIRNAIENLTLEKALQIGLSRRLYFYLKKKIKNNVPIKLKKKTIMKLSEFVSQLI